ncbi:hypothetical protein [Bosea sp. LjRoot237]|uniref:hypothetical protein n=1 Tax=Bosea sp. LjRoot237 TaxID=3342292 RepID=UPI003ECEF75A
MEREPKYPTPFLPVIFSDGVESMSHSQNNAKFYLSRLDPDIAANGGSQIATVCQIVMPLPGFVGAALFFEQRLELLVTEGKITHEEIEAQRRQMREDAKNARRPD